MGEEKIKHLEMIQAVLSRLAGNSFLLKGWTITIVVALFALAGCDTDHRFAILALLPVLTFWLLDAYYLWQEKVFRVLFDAVRLERKDVPVFSMDAKALRSEVPSWRRVMWTVTTAGFYLPILFIVIVAGIYTLATGG